MSAPFPDFQGVLLGDQTPRSWGVRPIADRRHGDIGGEASVS